MKTLIIQLLALSLITPMSASTRAQCYTNPITGQRICPLNPNSSTLNPSAHCRITIADGTLGSGTLVDRNDSVGLVLTCAHLFNDCPSRIIVTFPNGNQFAARLIDIDRTNDLAALTIRRPEVEPLSIADVEPTGQLTACGFGPNNLFRCIQGNITGHATSTNATHPSTIITGAVRPGDSGGEVLNTRGQLVGVIWGQRDNQTYTTCGQPVRDFLARLRLPTNRQPPAPPGVPTPQFDWQTWTTELDTRLRALDAKKQDKGDYLQHGDLNGYLHNADAEKLTGPLASRTELETKLSALSSRFESVHSIVESVQQHVAQISIQREGLLQGASLGKLAVSALGLSGPLAAAVIIAAGLIGRRTKQRLTTPTLNPNPSTLNPIAIDTPPLPQRTVPETHYVPIEKDTFAKAHQWASEHVARKYPGATEVLQTQDSLIKQFLAGK